MPLDILIGLQWGDEGKGKIVDLLTPNYDIVCRFQGGPNAGHSLQFDNKKFVLHTIPSGIFREDTINVIGNGVVIDPVILKDEIEDIEKSNIDIRNKLYISRRAHIIIPTHRLIDAAVETAKGKSKIGSTLKGIGPAYTDKISRQGLRVGDISHDFEKKYKKSKEHHLKILEKLYQYECDISEYEEKWKEGIELLKRFRLINSEQFLNEQLKNKKSILAEGAQGSMLDIDFGTYPFVTSSNTVCAGVFSGLGVAPQYVKKIFGVFKAYCTRVGRGPFPTELFGDEGRLLQEKGFEFGATTGRLRRCGWLDLVALKYAAKINGVTTLIMMKSDVLTHLKELKMATSYTDLHTNTQLQHFPYEVNEYINPNYRSFKSWQSDITVCRKERDLPDELINFITFIEKQIKIPVKIISVGPDRAESIIRRDL